MLIYEYFPGFWLCIVLRLTTCPLGMFCLAGWWDPLHDGGGGDVQLILPPRAGRPRRQDVGGTVCRRVSPPPPQHGGGRSHSQEIISR